jgi:hypothetical protein
MIEKIYFSEIIKYEKSLVNISTGARWIGLGPDRL